MTRTRFINNTAMVGGQGGTIYAMDPKDANFTDCSWLNNSAYQGGGIYASRFGKKADWAFTRCKFEGNTADQRGAAVWTTGMNYTFTATNFSANKALMGAAVYATNSGTKRKLNMIFNKCVMEGNAAEQSAGVAWVTGYKNVSLDSCRIAGNRAGQSAGGLYLQDTPARIAGCVLSGNRARSAAAVMLQGNDSVVQAVGSLFQDNMVRAWLVYC
jgi:predicted outer membrane repeat protein